MSFVSCGTGSPGLKKPARLERRPDPGTGKAEARAQVRAATGHATAVGNREIVVVDEEPHAGRLFADERDRVLVVLL